MERSAPKGAPQNPAAKLKFNQKRSNGGTRFGRRLNLSKVPELDLKLTEALRTFEATPRFVCVHIAEGRQAAVLCVQHPRQGLVCDRCHHRHLERHDQAEEHRCDRCGGLDDQILGAVAEVSIVTVVRQARGRRGLLLADAFVGGLGLCRACVAVLEEVPAPC